MRNCTFFIGCNEGRATKNTHRFARLTGFTIVTWVSTKPLQISKNVCFRICCIVLHATASCCTVSHSIELHCVVFCSIVFSWFEVLHCAVLHSIAFYCTVSLGIELHCVVPCCMLLNGTLRNSIELCCVTLYLTVLHKNFRAL